MMTMTDNAPFAASAASTDTPLAPPLLQVQGLQVKFGQKTVVGGIDFSLRAGEKLALVGESGSGKTVSALSLLRLVDGAQLQGRVQFKAQDLLQISERQMRQVRGGEIAMVFQEPMTALNPLMRVGQQIAEVVQAKQGLSAKETRRKTIELLARTGIPEPEKRAAYYPHQLSGGQRQRVVIAMALANKPALLIADEPTTALDVSLRLQILELLADLQRESGMAILLITHDLNLVRRFADRVAVMEHGLIVEQGAVADVFAAPAHAYTQKLMASKPVRNVVDASGEDAEPIRLAAKGLSVHYPTAVPGVRGWLKKGVFTAVKGVDLRLPHSQTLAIVGESGSGKTSLAQAVLGLLKFEGDLRIDGQAWQQPALQNNGHNRALRRKVQVVFQDPFSSLSPRLTLAEIVGEGLHMQQNVGNAAEQRARVRQALEEVGLTEAQFPLLLERYPHEFSGGQRQLISIARELLMQPDVLVLDEPTSALDATIQQQVLTLLQKLQKERQLAYLLITHDVQVVRAMAHTVMVMKDGAVIESGPVDAVLNHPQAAYTQALMKASAY